MYLKCFDNTALIYTSLEEMKKKYKFTDDAIEIPDEITGWDNHAEYYFAYLQENFSEDEIFQTLLKMMSK